MTTVYKWRVKCTTDNQDEYIWAETEPTVCPTNTAHSIDSAKTAIVDKVESNQVSIKEESTPTGEHFGCTSLVLNCPTGSTSSGSISWPFPVSALSVEFVSTSDHENDVINMCIGKDTTVGSITANVSPASAWTAQNYTAGDVVTDGGKVFSCILNTVSNEITSNTIYWSHGFEVPVSQTVIDNCKIGYYVKLSDGTNTDDCGRVISVDTVNDKLYLETNLTNSFLAATPTYIKITVFNIKDYQIGPAWERKIGDSKIGGSTIPKNVSVQIDYENKSNTVVKTFVGTVEYLY